MDTFIGRRQHRAGRLVLTVVLGAAVGAGAGWGAKLPVDDSQAPQTFGAALPQRPAKAQKPVRQTPSERAGIPLVGVPEAVRLKPIDRDAVLKEDALNERSARTKILRFGVARSLQVAPANGNWYDVAGGARMWVGDVVSTDALGVRLHFKDVHLPDGAELAVYGPTDDSPASGVVKSGFSRFDPDRYVELYEGSLAQRTDFWTGTLMGERARIEYLAPAGASDELPFAVDSLQHIYLDPVEKVSRDIMAKAAGPCHNDVTCFPDWADVARSVSLLGIVFSGGTGLCTGQLLTTQAGDFTPYYMTAHHCLSTPSEAASTEYFWFYQTSTCNGTPPSLNSVPRSLGATLMSTNAASDYTLLMVEGALPDNVFFSGWNSAKASDGTDIAAIHHPSGDFKRISFGFKDADAGGFCGSGHIRISWTDGPTEPGSSGSGVFRDDTQQFLGQLHGGPSACGNETFDCYGAFNTTYPKVKNLLKQGSDDNSEQNDTCGKARNVRPGKLANRIVKLLDTDWYKISVPAGKTVDIHLDFADADGDIDLAFFGSCGGDPLFVSDGTGDSEDLSLTNAGSRPAVGFFQVFLADDTRNNYSLTTTIHN
jgi:lysyl endopeptidase